MNAYFERKYIVQGIIIAAAFILVARLFYMQILDKQYVLSAEDNVLRRNVVYPARGIVVDRDNRILVQNQPVYDLMVVPKDVRAFDTLALCRLINIEREEFQEKLRKARQYSYYKASLFEKQLSDTLYASLQEALYQFPGFFVQNRTVRNYPHDAAAHVLGYVDEVTEGDIKRSNNFYRQGDYIGRSGIERAYEEVIRGHRGVYFELVDAFNRPKGSFQNGRFDTAAVAGEPLVSSLDLEVQELGEALMQNKIGSIVAIEPKTGEVLAFVSSPSYDPNLLVGRKRGNNYMKLLRDENNPLFIRPTQAQYPPGSTFKPLMALIGLQEGIVTADTRFPCYGGYRMGRLTVRCTHNHPPLNLPQSIQGSCNAWYCHEFARLIDNNPRAASAADAYKRWRQYLENFGLGLPSKIELPYEVSGIVKKASYYDDIYGSGHWRSSNIISLAIGQGELGVTPLQMANMMAAIANKGYYYRPHLVKSIGDEKYVPPEFTEKIHTGIDPEHFEIVHQGMQMVFEPGGTAVYSRINGINICGKTGTAQNPHGKDHSIFTAFAPRENPRIAIAVVVENAGYGSTWAGPIASLMIEKYLRDSISRPDYYVDRLLDANLMPEKKKVDPNAETVQN
ncbi:MAG TPA: penicillin-binding protein 2 [Anseongella sp.]